MVEDYIVLLERQALTDGVLMLAVFQIRKNFFFPLYLLNVCLLLVADQFRLDSYIMDFVLLP